MKVCNTHQIAKIPPGFQIGRLWRYQFMRTGILSALIVGCGLANLDTAMGQRRGRSSRNSRPGTQVQIAENNRLDESNQDNASSLSRQQTSKLVAQLNSEIKAANRKGDTDRALEAALKKLNIALHCPHHLPKFTWALKSCDVIISAVETRNDDNETRKNEVQCFLAEAQTGLRADKAPKHSGYNSALLKLVSACSLRLQGDLTPSEAELVSGSIAQSYLCDVAYHQIKEDRSALEQLAEDYSSLEEKLRVAKVATDLQNQIVLRLAECRFLLSDYQAAAELHQTAVAKLGEQEQYSDRLAQLKIALDQFAFPDQLKARESSWLLELIKHGASLTIEDPTSDPGVNRKLAHLGLTVDKIHSLVVQKLKEQEIKILPVGSPGPGLHISVRVGAAPNTKLEMALYSIHIDIGQTVMIPFTNSEIQHANIYSPEAQVGLSAFDRFSDDVFGSLAKSMDGLAADIKLAKSRGRLSRHDRVKAARQRVINNGVTEESFERYQRTEFLHEVAKNGVYVSRNLFGQIIRKQPWFERNGLTAEKMIQIIEAQLEKHHIKVVSSIEMNRLALAGQSSCWLSAVPLIANGVITETELTGYSLELCLQNPFAYLCHAGEEPFVGRIVTPATARRVMNSGIGSMREEFEEQLIYLVDRFAIVVDQAAGK